MVKFYYMWDGLKLVLQLLDSLVEDDFDRF